MNHPAVDSCPEYGNTQPSGKDGFLFINIGVLQLFEGPISLILIY